MRDGFIGAGLLALSSLATASADGAELSIGDGGSLRVIDGPRTFQLGGRARLGMAFYDEDITDLPTGLELDQLLLQLRADFGNRWQLNIAYEFVAGAVFETTVTRTGLPFGDVQVGQFRPQIGLFDGGSWILFNSRSMVEQALTLPRSVGVGLEGAAGRVSYSASINGDQVGEDTPGDDPFKYSGRFVVRPGPESWGTFHVGLNVSLQETAETRIHRFSADPIAALDDTPTLLEVTNSPADYRKVYGAETIWSRGPLTLQSEYMTAEVDAPGSPELDGYYVQGALIYGAHRNYSLQSGTVGRPVLQDPARGAWEFALRYDTIDMSDAGGGSADNVALAIVRYFSNPLRLGTSITHSDIDNGVNGDERIVSVHLRLQWFL